MKKRTKIISIVLLSLLIIVGVSAGLINYLSNTISTDITTDTPILLEKEEFELDIIYSGEDDFVLIKIINKADSAITGDFEITVSPDAVGMAIAITEDINYCFTGQGEMMAVWLCEIDYLMWMSNNIDWIDWYADAEYSDVRYPSGLVVDTNGDSFHSLGGYVGNKLVLPDQTIPAGESLYEVIYVATNPALEPGTYIFDMKFVP